MSKKLIAFVAILAICSGYSFAAVENLKVGGSIDTYAVNRSDYDLGVHAATGLDDGITALASITKLKFFADLTEEVNANIVVKYEHLFGASAVDRFYVPVAFVTLKDILDSPLTLKIGKQKIVLGSGLLISKSTTNQTTSGLSPYNAALLGDLNPGSTFAGITGVIDLSPATITLGYVKITEGATAVHNDTNLYLVNLNYDLEDIVESTSADLYYVGKNTQGKAAAQDDVKNVGVRVVSSALENLTLSGEFCYQFAKEDGMRADNKIRSDTAIELAATYALQDMEWNPTIGIDYTLISENWDPMYEGQTPANIANALFPNTNVAAAGLTLTAQPREDISLKLRYVNLKLVEEIIGLGNDYCAAYAINTDKKALGDEIDLAIAYDYTEDVQLGLNLDYFNPGSVFADTNDEAATQLLGTMKVSF
ncbi:MAG: alginate export family protein [Candidatus Omnitrophica bacterium]|nr:alginate export family protein [Candidatus Omnitrophota bacterium]